MKTRAIADKQMRKIKYINNKLILFPSGKYLNSKDKLPTLYFKSKLSNSQEKN